jgi:two-component sensor histidine kinase
MKGQFLAAPFHPDVTTNLALALIASSNAPLLLLDGDLAVVAASASFCQAFQINAENIRGFKIYELGKGEWDKPQLRALLKSASRGFADFPGYEMDLTREGRGTRRLVLSAQKLDYGDENNVRLILTVSDVTDARLAEKLKDDLLREKAVLLQEVHHRVANSLQIIASVLLQSARKVQSDETRTHLHDAHNRILSVATLQRRLAASSVGDVQLRPYLTDLCESLGASMIPDRDQILLQVRADEASVTANVSVSLGLIVTELVINALKHAFPDHRRGTIKVGYSAHGPQ